MQEMLQLRENNEDLIYKLKQAQEELKQSIIWNKHSDPHPSHPMSSTLIDKSKNHGLNLNASMKKSKKLLQHTRLKLDNCKLDKQNTQILRSSLKRITTRPLNQPTTERKFEDKENCGQIKLSSTNMLMQEEGNKRPYSYKCKDTSKSPKKSIITSVSTANRNTGKVKFNLEESIQRTPSRKFNQPERPLLGYDWIAGMMDVAATGTPGIKSSRQTLDEISDDFLHEITEFRSLNRQDCSGQIAPWREPIFTPISTRKRDKSPDPADTQDLRIVDFTVNSRLFPVPVDGSTTTQGTPSSPRYIRISVPKAVLATPHQYKPKSVCAFDSLALPDHCLPGYKHNPSFNKTISFQKTQDSPHLDLRTSMVPDNHKPTSSKTNKSSFYDKSASQDFLNESYALQYKLLQLKNE